MGPEVTVAAEVEALGAPKEVAGATGVPPHEVPEVVSVSVVGVGIADQVFQRLAWNVYADLRLLIWIFEAAACSLSSCLGPWTSDYLVEAIVVVFAVVEVVVVAFVVVVVAFEPFVVVYSFVGFG